MKGREYLEENDHAENDFFGMDDLEELDIADNAVKLESPQFDPKNVSKDKSQTEKTMYLENNSSSIVYYKPEDGTGVYPLEGYSVLYEPIDGVATSKYKNAVTKIPTGSAATITEEGGVQIHFYGFGEVSRMFGYGWITEVPDDNWKELFKMANEIGKATY